MPGMVLSTGYAMSKPAIAPVFTEPESNRGGGRETDKEIIY